MEQALDAILGRITRSLGQKYQQLDGILTATAEMDKLATDGEPGAFGVYLEMRQNHMKRIDQLDKQVEGELQSLPGGLAAAIRAGRPPEGQDISAMPGLTKLLAADKRNRALHARIVQADRQLREKIGATTGGSAV